MCQRLLCCMDSWPVLERKYFVIFLLEGNKLACIETESQLCLCHTSVPVLAWALCILIVLQQPSFKGFAWPYPDKLRDFSRGEKLDFLNDYSVRQVGNRKNYLFAFQYRRL